MRRSVLAIATGIAAIGLACSSAQATVLDFNTVSGAGWACIGIDASPCYGDNVTALTDAYGNYSEGNGFTPDVTASYANSFATGTVNGGLTSWGSASSGTVLGLASPITQGFLTLTASAGHSVTLNSFDVGTFGQQETTFNILAGGPDGTLLMSILFSSAATLQELVGLTASQLTIAWTNWNTGLAKVDFDEAAVAAVPLPAALPLFASAIVGLGFLGRRRNRKVAAAA